MGQQERQYETHHAERQAVLSDLDAQINRLDTNIASLTVEKNTLERTRSHILPTPDTVRNNPNGNTPHANQAPKPPLNLTYPSHFFAAKKAPSSLRQQAIIRNAMERDKIPSLPGSAGLLSSGDFEAAFEDDKVYGGDDDGHGNGNVNGHSAENHDVRTLAEGLSSSAAETHSAPSSTSTANATSHINTPFPASETSALNPPTRNGQGAHWQAKRVTKHKLQENSAKAREARRRKLDQAGPMSA